MERLLAWYRVTSSTRAVVALVGANLIPLAGALFLGWSVWLILIIYWLENGIVGVVNVLKMRRAEGPIRAAGGGLVNETSASALSLWFSWLRSLSTVRPSSTSVGSFVVCYGAFWLIQGVFVLTLPLFAAADVEPLSRWVNALAAALDPIAIALGVFALAVSHGLSFWLNYIKGGEYLHTSKAALWFAPYGRVFVLHFTIILGGMAIVTTEREIPDAAAVAILVGVKILLDVGFHLSEHRKAGAQSLASTSIGS
ncbi:MAG TPA: DUF6498-containing protein [Candidatus Limnocylindrales bacterium]|nr:DUF6498-containing protein [Candidatus Limnocylindrales bacterium]